MDLGSFLLGALLWAAVGAAVVALASALVRGGRGASEAQEASPAAGREKELAARSEEIISR